MDKATKAKLVKNANERVKIMPDINRFIFWAQPLRSGRRRNYQDSSE